jgi:hypothetical protein
MDAANKQFSNDRPNLLLVCPDLGRPFFSDRIDLLRAAFGESKITWEVNVATGEGGPAEVKFCPEGRFLNTTTPAGRPLKQDGLPAYRRISALACLEETVIERFPFPDFTALLDVDDALRHQRFPLWQEALDLHNSEENRAWVEHNLLVLHNPHAYHPFSRDIFDSFPQLIPAGDQMEWTDGEVVVV